MHFAIRYLMIKDESIVWKMLQYAAHESSIESVRQQLLGTASNGRFPPVRCVAPWRGLFHQPYPDKGKGVRKAPFHRIYLRSSQEESIVYFMEL